MGSKIKFCDGRVRENILDALATIGGSSCLRRNQECQRMRHNRDLGGQCSEQLAISFHINSWLKRARGRPAENPGPVVQLNPLHSLLAGDQAAQDVPQIGHAARGAAKHQAKGIAFERCTRRQLAQNPSEIANAYRQKLRDVLMTELTNLNRKILHAMGEPQLCRLEVIGSHAQSALEQHVELVEEMCIHANPGSDSKVARAISIIESPVIHSSYGNTLSARDQRDARRCYS